MKIRIALAGELPFDPHMYGKVDLLVGQISGYLCKDNAAADIQLLISSSYTGGAWQAWNETHCFEVCAYGMQTEQENAVQASQTVRMDTKLRNLVGEAMCDRADAILAVWDEDAAQMSGAVWELMRIAYERKAPCIWISTKTQEVYCIWEAYYKKYSPQYLGALAEPLLKEEFCPRRSEEEQGRMYAFWERRRNGFLKKYKAETAVYQSEKDILMNQEFEMEPESVQGSDTRRILAERFHRFDRAAIAFNTKFQTMIYARSVLPFIATAFLAIGFYAETLVGKTLSGLIPAWTKGFAAFAAFLAGIGFLIHGGINFYVYRLSRNRRIEEWRQEFVRNRYLAEILRVLVHFVPYGVMPNLRALCPGDKKLCAGLRHLTDDTEPQNQQLDAANVRHILQHLREMLEDQRTYHQASINRYKDIVDSLEKWGRIFFYVGFAVVLGRGALQFVLAMFPIQTAGGMDINGITRSFLNMAALLLPALSGYFSTKVVQNNFSFNLDNHIRMLARLDPVYERVISALGQENVPFEVFNSMADELARIMLVEDTISWQQRYNSAAVKPL